MQTILYLAIAMFAISLAIHILIWQVLPSRRQIILLVLIFMLSPALFLVLRFAGLGPHALSPQEAWLAWGLASLLHLSLGAVYVNLYTAVAGFSPSIAILEKAEQSPHGLERHELAPSWFSDKHLSGARRENLLAAGFICESDGSLLLTPRGRMLALGLLTFRRFLGLPDVAKG